MNNDFALEELLRRMDGESDAAYSAFCKYAMLPETSRPYAKSIPLLAETCNLAEVTLRQYANIFKWNERLASIQSYLLMESIKEQREQNKELNLEFLAKNRKIKIDMMDNLDKCNTVLKNALGWAAIANEEKVTEWILDKDGNEVPLKTEVKLGYKISDIPAIIGAMEKAIRLVNEIPTEVINHRPISNRNISEITDLAKLEELERELDQELLTYDNPQ